MREFGRRVEIRRRPLKYLAESVPAALDGGGLKVYFPALAQRIANLLIDQGRNDETDLSTEPAEA